MSFTLDTKKELCGLRSEKKCCELAEITGFLRFAGSITLSGGKMGAKLSSDSPAVARHYLTMLKEYFGSKTSLEIGESENPAGGKTYTLNITPEQNSEAILRETGMLGIREGSNYLTDGIDPDIVRKRCCKKAALRGIFLAAGSVSDPKASRGYHLEISCGSEQMAGDVKKLITGFSLKAKIVQRKGKFVVYLKEGEQIGDFLSLIGATNQMFILQDAMITKNAKNNANRATNCVVANAAKSVEAAQKQLADIRVIDTYRGLGTLPPRLRETALMRMQNPDMSLLELAECFEPPLTKSGLNHRLEKLAQIADQLREYKGLL